MRIIIIINIINIFRFRVLFMSHDNIFNNNRYKKYATQYTTYESEAKFGAYRATYLFLSFSFLLSFFSFSNLLLVFLLLLLMD